MRFLAYSQTTRSRLSHLLKGNILSGLVVLSWHPSARSRTCGAPSKNMTSPALVLSIAVRTRDYIRLFHPISDLIHSTRMLLIVER
jgi:hypothetical protein